MFPEFYIGLKYLPFDFMQKCVRVLEKLLKCKIWDRRGLSREALVGVQCESYFFKKKSFRNYLMRNQCLEFLTKNISDNPPLKSLKFSHHEIFVGDPKSNIYTPDRNEIMKRFSDVRLSIS